MEWYDTKKLSSKEFKCGSCDKEVASQEGYFVLDERRIGTIRHIARDTAIYICHYCSFPNLITSEGEQFPGPKFGDSIEFISEPSVEELYNEARKCFSVNAFNAVMMCCRKLLMNISVSEGAKEGLSFAKYIDFLGENGFVPPNGKEWIDEIRKLGNEANHKIIQPTKENAELILVFTCMLLRFVYEMPGRLNDAKQFKV